MRITKKRSRFTLVAIMIFSLLVMYGFTPTASLADTLDSVKDTVSTSAPGGSAIHTIVFNAGPDLTSGTVITVDFTGQGYDLSTVATGTCPGTAAFATTTNTITCTVGSTLASTTNHTITANYITNPSSTGATTVTISHDQSGAAESSETIVYIVDTVSVSATVNAVLTFSVATTTPSDSVRSEAYTGTSSPTQIAFGALSAGTSYIMGHKLNVTTNARDGFAVTVEQDQELQTGAGAIIDNYSTSSPSAWAAPTADENDNTTWGHWAVTSDDKYGTDSYQGLDNTNPLTVFDHTGPVDASSTYVGYKLEISALQEAGDYSNSLTYICTPTF